MRKTNKYIEEKKELKKEISNCKNNKILFDQLSFIHSNWDSYENALSVAKLLQSDHRDARYFASISLRVSKNKKVVPYLIKAIKNPIDEGYTAPYIWSCAEFDCTEYLSFFAKKLLSLKDANSSAWGCIEVIKLMQGPFDIILLKNIVKKSIAKVVPNTSTHYSLHKLLFAELGKIIHEKLFQQFYIEWKTGTDEKNK